MCCAPYAAVEATVVEATNQLFQDEKLRIAFLKFINGEFDRSGGWITSSM